MREESRREGRGGEGRGLSLQLALGQQCSGHPGIVCGAGVAMEDEMASLQQRLNGCVVIVLR